MVRRRPPIGVILAGGGGRRIGGSKAIVKLRGRPLITYPLAVLQAVLEDVAIVAKPDTELPSLPGVTVWIEPAAPQHPIVGITHALALAGRRPVLVAAADMPFLTLAVVEQLASADPGRAPAVIATEAGRLHPLLGCYQPQAAAPLAASLAAGDVRAHRRRAGAAPAADRDRGHRGAVQHQRAGGPAARRRRARPDQPKVKL